MSPSSASRVLPRFVPASVLVLTLGFTGCAHTYNVKVDALRNPSVSAGASYCLVPRDDVKADFNPAFAEAERLVEAALATRGYYRAALAREAEMVVELDLGIGSQRKSAIEDPQYYNSSHLPPPTPVVNSRRNAKGHPWDEELPVAEAPPPTRITVVTMYQKFLTVSARETERATAGLRDPVELWRVNVAIEDRAETVDECLPVLVVTAVDNIGHSTAQRENVRVSDRTPDVLFANADL